MGNRHCGQDVAATAAGRCTLDLELVTQDFDNEEAAGLYPINAARNRALLLAQSEVPSAAPASGWLTPR